MKLVGATNWFIRVPFMLEGLVQGLVGGLMAIGFVFLASNWLNDFVGGSRGIDLLEPFATGSDDVALACLIVGVTAIVLSVGSSLIATRRFLNV